MKTLLNEFPPEINSFFIAATGGLLRYLVNVLNNTIKHNWEKFFIWVTVAGLVGVLTLWVVPLLTDNVEYQKAIIYVSGMLAIQIVKIISDKVPEIISTYIQRKGKE